MKPPPFPTDRGRAGRDGGRSGRVALRLRARARSRSEGGLAVSDPDAAGRPRPAREHVGGRTAGRAARRAISTASRPTASPPRVRLRPRSVRCARCGAPDDAGRALRSVVRLLPERRREWGLAMEAELAGLDARSLAVRAELRARRARPPRDDRQARAARCSSRARPGSRYGCSPRSRTARSGSRRSRWSACSASSPGSPDPRASWAPPRSPSSGRRRSIFLRGLQVESDATAGIVVWTAMLSIYAVALTRAPARGFTIGAAVAAAWLVATVIDPGVPTSSTPRHCWPSRSPRSARAAGSPGSARQPPPRS